MSRAADGFEAWVHREVVAAYRMEYETWAAERLDAVEGDALAAAFLKARGWVRRRLATHPPLEERRAALKRLLRGRAVPPR